MEMTTSDFIGLSKRRAQDLAESRNLVFRLIRIDAEAFLVYTDDHVADRVCVELDNGTVTKATLR